MGKILLVGYILTFILGTYLTVHFIPEAYARLDYGSVVLPKPTNAAVTSTFKNRFHPIKKKWRPHRGVDYGTPSGTSITAIGPAQSMVCKNDPNGYGNYAEVYYECDVKARFAHLNKCDAANKTIITGNTGGSTGPHLHHEIWLGGASVDPAEAYGQNLCDPAVRERLIKDANEKLNGQAGKDGTIQRSEDEGVMTYVPPDGSSGGGYTIIDSPDGRQIIVPDPAPGDYDTPTLPPPTEGDLTPEGTIEHEVTGCATDTWTAMVNQSVLQSRREMMFNQRFIAKGDSVMAYACLDEPLTKVREDLGPVFSETKRWVNVQVDIIGKVVTVNKELGEYSLDGALVNAVYTPYEAWIRSNFTHDFLGGLVEGESHAEEEGGESHSHDQAYSPCSTMQDVWKAAKCMNMEDEPMFPKFDELIENSSDPRKYPHGYQCNYTGIKQSMIDTAKGKEVKFDKITTHLDMLFPSEEECHPPIKTGVTVHRQEGEESEGPEIDVSDSARITKQVTYADGLCITAGCTYQKNEGGGEEEGGSCVLK